MLAAFIDFPSMQLALWRVGLGAALYLLGTAAIGHRSTRRTLRISAAGGAAFSLNLALFYTALQLTTVANAVIIAALQPIMVALVADRLFGERIDRRAAVGIAVAFAGVALVVFGATGVRDWSLRGDLLALVGTVCWAWYFVASKQARSEVGAWEYQTGVLVVGTVVLAPLTLVIEGSPGLPSTSILAWTVLLVLLPGTGHLLMNWAHPNLPITLSSTLTLALPPLSTLGAAVFLDQSLAVVQAAGMAVVLATLAWFVRQQR